MICEPFAPQIVQKSTKVELALIQSEIDEIDKFVMVGINELTWTSESNIDTHTFFFSNN